VRETTIINLHVWTSKRQVAIAPREVSFPATSKSKFLKTPFFAQYEMGLSFLRNKVPQDGLAMTATKVALLFSLLAIATHASHNRNCRRGGGTKVARTGRTGAPFD
jgi:hypothetical protein